MPHKIPARLQMVMILVKLKSKFEKISQIQIKKPSLPGSNSKYVSGNKLENSAECDQKKCFGISNVMAKD